MTTPEEIAHYEAMETQALDLVDESSNEPEPTTDSLQDNEPQRSSAVIQEIAILNAAAYWGIDHGSLPNNEP